MIEDRAPRRIFEKVPAVRHLYVLYERSYINTVYNVVVVIVSTTRYFSGIEKREMSGAPTANNHASSQ